MVEGIWSGPFNIDADVDASFKQVNFSGKIAVPHLPAKIGARPSSLLKQPSPLTSLGITHSGKLDGVKIRASSVVPWDADGSGNLNFSHPPAVVNARFALHDIAVAALAAATRMAWRLTYSGLAEADVQLEGPLANIGGSRCCPQRRDSIQEPGFFAGASFVESTV